VSEKNVSEKNVSEKNALAAKELADWLENSNHPSFLVKEDVTGSNWRGKVSGRTGIIYFEDYYLRSDRSGGDHIDL
jgi:type VI secretion system (T6SS) effector Tae4 (amidase)